MRTTGIYCITNLLDGKRYIGSSARSLKGRWGQHRRDLLANRHRNRHLQFAWNRDGEAAFVFSVLELCSPDECLAREQFYIDKYSSARDTHGYNLTPVAGSQLGFHHSEETKALLSSKNKGRKHTPEAVEKIRIAKTGWKRSPEAIEKTAAYWRGKQHTKEHRDKIRAAILGRKQSPETRAKIGAAHKGRRFSDEHRANIGATSRGRIHSAETRARIAAAGTGKRHTAESIEKMRLAAVASWERRRARKESVA